MAGLGGVIETDPDEGFGAWKRGWGRRDWRVGRSSEALGGNEGHRGEGAGVDELEAGTDWEDAVDLDRYELGGAVARLGGDPDACKR